MAVVFGEKKMFEGAVLQIKSHYWMDGMLEEYAICWNSEKCDTETVTFGYYGIDGSNLAGGWAEEDATPETWRQVLRSFKPAARRAFADSVTAFKREIRKDANVVVVRGSKIAKGTKLRVFWVGEKPTYRSRQYSWMHETETIAGCYTESGEKVWVKAEYLNNVDEIHSPNAKERRKFIKSYIKDRARQLGAMLA